MRTTLSLDDDVAHLLNQEMRKSGASFKATVNRLLRLGLVAAQQRNRKSFSIRPRNMGLPDGLTYDNVAELLEVIEGARHK